MKMSQTDPTETRSKLTTPSPMRPNVLSLAAQLARLMAWARAMSLKQPLTAAQADVHMEEWALIAEEIGFEALSEAVRYVMRNDTEWFPSPKAIRQRAGLNRDDRFKVEANAAWNWVSNYTSNFWHPNIGPYKNAPAIPPRIEYAIRQVGGLRRIYTHNYESEPFMRRDFIEALRLAPLAVEMGPQLAASFEIKSFADKLDMNRLTRGSKNLPTR
jgi:hypothetical protein